MGRFLHHDLYHGLGCVAGSWGCHTKHKQFRNVQIGPVEGVQELFEIRIDYRIRYLNSLLDLLCIHVCNPAQSSGHVQIVFPSPDKSVPESIHLRTSFV